VCTAHTSLPKTAGAREREREIENEGFGTLKTESKAETNVRARWNLTGRLSFADFRYQNMIFKIVKVGFKGAYGCCGR